MSVHNSYSKNFHLLYNSPPTNTGDTDSVPESGRSPGVGIGNPLHYPRLGNPTDRGAWRGYGPWGRKESDTIEHRHRTEPCGRKYDGPHFKDEDTEAQG